MIKLILSEVFLSRSSILTGILFCTILFSGCATIIYPPLLPDEKKIAQESALDSWAQVLNSHVDHKGRVNFENLDKDYLPLYRYIKFVAQSGPMNNPERYSTFDERLAYYLNSYNALAMYGVLSKGIPQDFGQIWDRAEFFKLTVFNIGGMKISLYDYENKIIRPLGDPRIHFALNCMVRGCPRLPKKPFLAETVQSTLNTLSKEFVNHPRHVEALHAEQMVRISEIFRFYTEDFVNTQSAPSLITYINNYRTDPIPEHYKVEFIPYDWTINNQ